MDTRVFCVYNLAGGVFVSKRVTVADSANEPLKMLNVLVSSMSRDGESGLWLKPLYGVPAVPRLFPFDLVYLDKDHRVLEAIEILHGVAFPSCAPEAASALVLPLRSMASSKTRQGDRLIVCLQEEIERLLAAIDAPMPATTKPNGVDAVRAAASLFLVSRPPTEAPAVEDAISLEAQPKAVGTSAPSATTNGHYDGKLAEDPEVQDTGAQEIKAPELVEAKIAQTQNSSEQEDAGDIFANWVASPFALPSWMAKEAEPRPWQVSAAEVNASVSTPSSAQPPEIFETVASTASVQGSMETRNAAPDANTTIEPAKAEQAVNHEPAEIAQSASVASDLASESADRTPARTVTPQQPRATAFTVAQYGTWRASAATAVGPISSKNGTTASGAGPAHSMNSVQASQTVPGEIWRAKDAEPEGPHVKQEPSPAASPGIAAGVTSRTAQKRPLQNSAQLVEPTSEEVQTANIDPAIAGVPAQSGAPDVREPSSAAKTSLAKQQIAKDLSDSSPEPLATKNGIPAQQLGPNGTSKKAADELTMTVPLPRFMQPEQKGKLKISIQRVPGNGKSGAEDGSLKSRFQRWLKPAAPPSDRRRAHRRYVPGMVAFHFTGGAPKPHEVADISMSGFYMMTQDRWMPGTMIQMTLQKPCARGERKQTIAILARIVRKGSDGVAAEFVMPEMLNQYDHAVPPERTTDRFSLARFL